MGTEMISVFGADIGSDEIKEVQSSLEAQWMGIGPKVRSFEEQFSLRLGLPDLAMIDSGSNSLYIAVSLLNLPPGTEVILPSFTWISCAHAIVLNGCVPVFCDVDLDTHNVTIDTIRPHITKKTGAIMVVHYAGKPVRLGPILGLGIPVIEDAAHAVDSRLDGKACGAMGALGIFSFDAVKNLATPDGGGVTARDPELIKRAKLLRYCGIGKSGFEASANKERWWEYSIVDFYPRFLPNDIAASVGLAQLRRLDSLQSRRRSIWERYQSEFAQYDWLVRPRDAERDERHSYFTYCVRVPGARNRFAKMLLERKIYTTLRYHPLHMNAIYKSSARLPVCERLNEEALSLPIHPRLSDADVERVIAAVKEFDARV